MPYCGRFFHLCASLLRGGISGALVKIHGRKRAQRHAVFAGRLVLYMVGLSEPTRV
jgi:hypothetical protein